MLLNNNSQALADALKISTQLSDLMRREDTN
jgi:hypothetical protein